MASNGQFPSPTPDLASILKTLASLTPQNQQNPDLVIPSNVQPVNKPPPRPTEEPRPNSHQNLAPTLESFLPTASHANNTSKKPVSVSKNLIDPTSILDWPSGLRYVMKAVAKHENIIDEVRRLLKLQHEHEEQWWKERNALIQRLKAWEEGQKKLDEVLKAVGGVVSTSQPGTDANLTARELKTFDLKVYKAQMQMVREMNAKLRSLGIPFFGTRSELVRPASKKSEIVQNVDQKRTEIIDEADLVELQRRMLQMLEDLCND